ncbi:Collagen alpha-2(IV) chain [Amphibalanus amphitrite]|uniref:Collagen alpha-2(IV) chain n=1 Tax=Amphibalanus amphitrite TaxID=1232801 RepID=A0A6A4WA70_AMPAM|nr:Collagen alpha-2(IV) chain [Amphibalanus amphitrite]
MRQAENITLQYGGVGDALPARVQLDRGRRTVVVTVDGVGTSLYDFGQGVASHLTLAAAGCTLERLTLGETVSHPERWLDWVRSQAATPRPRTVFTWDASPDDTQLGENLLKFCEGRRLSWLAERAPNSVPEGLVQMAVLSPNSAENANGLLARRKRNVAGGRWSGTAMSSWSHYGDGQGFGRAVAVPLKAETEVRGQHGAGLAAAASSVGDCSGCGGGAASGLPSMTAYVAPGQAGGTIGMAGGSMRPDGAADVSLPISGPFPGATGGWPGMPGGPGTQPGGPGTQPGRPGWPGHPVGPGGPGWPGQPAGPGTQPGGPGWPGHPVGPGRLGTHPGGPGWPGQRGGPGTMPAGPGTMPGGPGWPGQPGGPGTQPGGPGWPGQPVGPGGPGAQPGGPGWSGQPGGPGWPVQPGRPGTMHGGPGWPEQPGGPGTQPGGPGTMPGGPGWPGQPGGPGTMPGGPGWPGQPGGPGTMPGGPGWPGQPGGPGTQPGGPGWPGQPGGPGTMPGGPGWPGQPGGPGTRPVGPGVLTWPGTQPGAAGTVIAEGKRCVMVVCFVLHV